MKTIIFTLALLLSAALSHAQISNLTATNVTNTSVTLNWVTTSTVAQFTSVQITSPTTSCCQVVAPGTATSLTHAGLSPSTAYTFLLQARNSAGSVIGTATVSATTQASTPPPPPPAPTCGTGNATQVVSWQDNSSGAAQEQGFAVEKSCDGGTSWESAGAVGTDITSLTVQALPNGVNVCYRVAAFNSVGQSAFSSMACKVTALMVVVPGVPGTIVITNQVP